MRRSTLLAVFAALAAFLAAQSALAQTAPTPGLPSFLVNGNHDPAVTQLAYFFGALFSGGSSSATMLTTYCKLLNTVVLGIAGSFFLWQLSTGIVQTAHDGEALGRQWSSLWVPIRFVAAGLMMVPIGNGYCGLQQVLAQGATISLDAGGWTWSQLMQTYMSGGASISTNYPSPSYESLAKSIWDSSICRWEANLLNNSLGWPSENALGVLAQSDGGDGTGTTTWTMANKGALGLMSGHCGDVTYIPSGAAAKFPAIAQAHIQATATLITNLDDLAKRIVAAQRPGAAQSDVDSQPQASDIINAIKAAEASVAAAVPGAVKAVQQQMANTNGSTTSKTIAAMSAGGWMFAGSWYNYVAAQNGAVSDALSSVPAASGPASFLGTRGLLTSFGNADITNKIDAAADATWKIAIASLTNPSLAAWRPPPGSVFDNDVEAMQKQQPANSDKEGDRKLNFLTRDLANAYSGLQSVVASGWSIGSGGAIANAVLPTAPINPLGGLVAMGYGILTAIFGFLSASALAAGAAGLSVLGGTAIIAALATPLGATCSAIVLGFLAAGGFLAVILPMMPYVIWTMSMISYFILLVEAMIAAPIWCFAHLKAGGEGFHGQAGGGYGIMFNILLRPTLMIGGLVSGLVVMTLGVTVVNITYGSALQDSMSAMSGGAGLGALGGAAAGAAAGATGGAAILGLGLGAIQTLLFTLLLKFGLYVVIIVGIAERSFSLIHKLPDAVSRWAGIGGEQLGDEQHATKIRGAIIGVSDSKNRAIGTADPERGRKPKAPKEPPGPGRATEAGGGNEYAMPQGDARPDQADHSELGLSASPTGTSGGHGSGRIPTGDSGPLQEGAAPEEDEAPNKP